MIGTSRYAQRLRQQVRQASRLSPAALQRRGPVLIFGEPGLEKDNLAALIHFGSGNRQDPMIQVDCQMLRPQELLGRPGHPGLLAWLGEGTLLLNNIQDLSPALKPAILKLLSQGEYAPLGASAEAPPQHSRAWIMMVAEQSLPDFDQWATLGIKVPPLRVRKADIAAQVNYYLAQAHRWSGAAEQDKTPRPRLAPEALRRLQSYDFPNNLRELAGLVERALVQSAAAPLLTEEVFWSVGSRSRRFRLNLLNVYPGLRRFLRSPWWPDRLNYGITFGLYAAVVALLFLGPQTRDQNIALNLFWAWWWPLVLLSFPLVGRLWCAVCPFMIYGEVTQWLSLQVRSRLPGNWAGLALLPWPRRWADRWGGWLLFAGFALILLWEELWNLENTAYLSAWLLILITAGAMVCSALFERRFWCRYLCPIGGMNGLFAKLSMTELRAQQGICAATCDTYSCYKGGPALGEGQDTGGCPVYSHPAQLGDNRNCVLCMTCLKACPHRSVELNLRPPGIELWTTHQPLWAEVSLLFLLLGAVVLHRLPQLLALLGAPGSWLEDFAIHGGLSLAALGLPGAIAWTAYGLLRLLSPLFQRILPRLCRPRSFLSLAYGYLPLVLGANLAHYLALGLTEAGQVIPVTLATLGQQGELSADAATLTWAAHPAVIAFLQGSSLLLGLVLSLVLTQKIARQDWRQLVPQHLALTAITVGIWQLVI